MKPDTHNSDYRADIDGLRAIAVSIVVIFHAFPHLLPGGFVGVDVFFVVSGYLITAILLKEMHAGAYSLAHFYNRRIRRIFPVLILVLVACYGAAQFLMFGDELQQLSKQIAGGAGFVSNFVLWNEVGYFDSAAETKPLLHLWSLGVEEQFYLVWPLLLFGLWKLRVNAIYLTIAVLIGSFALSLYLTSADPVAGFYAPYSRFWELMLGAALVQWRATLPPAAAHASSLAGLALILFAAFAINSQSEFPGWWALLPTIGTVLVLAAGPSAFCNRLLSWRPIVGIGLVSYALYLWHWPMLVFARFIEGYPPPPDVRLYAILISFVLSVLCYFGVERPIRRGTHAKLKVASLCVAMTALGAVSFATYRDDNAQTYLSRGIKSYALDSREVSDLWRRNRCMIGETAAFAPECDAAAPDVLLWGDSHAAALYPGLSAMQKRTGLSVAQYNASRCPPIFGYVSADLSWNNQACTEINEVVRQRIVATRPRTVIMAAWWMKYRLTDLAKTITSLRDIGVEHIILVGDVPFPAYDFRRYLAMHRADPQILASGRAPAFHLQKTAATDAELKSIAADAGASFLSIHDAICASDGCLVLVGENPKEISFVDGDHVAPRTAALIMQGADIIPHH